MSAIELKQVSFSYAGTTKILENMEFNAGYWAVTLIYGQS